MKMTYVPTTELIRLNRKKKWCAVTQTIFRENESQYLYGDCAFQREPEPHEFPHGIGLHYPPKPEKEVDYDCESICEDEKKLLPSEEVEELPQYMKPVISSRSKNSRHVLVFPHRNKPPFKQPHHPRLAEQYMILEPFNNLSYRALQYLESCLSFESIVDKLDTSASYPHDSKARVVALRLLLNLPPQPLEDLEGSTTTSGRVHNRIYLSARGTHHRVLTPRCDTSIVAQLGRASAVILLQKCLRGRAMQLSLERTRQQWEESYEELNGFSISYQSDPNSGMELVTYATEMTIVRTVTGQHISPILDPLVKPEAKFKHKQDQLEIPDSSNEGVDEESNNLWGQLMIHH